MHEQQPLIKTEGLKKYFKVPQGYLHAVDDINLEIYKKKTLGVVGESGCGKSTLGRVLLRSTIPTSGHIYFEGKDITNISKKEFAYYRQQLQMIFQDPYSSLDPRMSVFDLIAEPLHVNRAFQRKEDLEKRVFELMNIVGLADRFINSYPHEMDGGRRQRIGIARALALEPKFIVCDEPVSALDVSIQAQILNLLMDLQRDRGYTYMFVTHDLSVVKHISNEIMVMYLGKCVEKASSHELFAHPLHPYTHALLSAIPEPKLNRNREKKIISGEVTSPINPKPGCRFAARCELCRKECLEQDIELREVEEGHFVACNNY